MDHSTMDHSQMHQGNENPGVLYKQEVVLCPAAGAILMTVSTVVLAVNAGLLHFENKYH
jgi:hypothetical protein